MKIEELVPIVYHGERVLTGKQVATLYGVDYKRIKDNFKSNKKYFTEGEHFFKVEGEQLRLVKEQVNEEIGKRIMSGQQAEKIGSLSIVKSPLATFTCSAILYTAKGCARHCKSLSSPTAWRVFGELEKAYFDNQEVAPVQSVLPLPEPDKKKSCVYVLGMSSALTKIGMTGDILERARIIERQSGAQVERIYNSVLINREAAAALEKFLHDKFADKRREGEFFDVPFEDACRALVLATSELPTALPELPLVDKLISIADKMEPCPQRQQILIRAANLLDAHFTP